MYFKVFSFFNYMYACGYVHMSACACGGQMCIFGGVSCLMWMLGIELRSLTRAVCVLNQLS